MYKAEPQGNQETHHSPCETLSSLLAARLAARSFLSHSLASEIWFSKSFCLATLSCRNLQWIHTLIHSRCCKGLLQVGCLCPCGECLRLPLVLPSGCRIRSSLAHILL